MLSARQRSLLQARVEHAVARARRHGGALAAITVALAPQADPSSLVLASRRGGEPYFCFEQPDRDGAALAALGCVEAIEARGPDRFAEVAERWRALVAHAQVDAPDGPAGAGLVAVGGFAFGAEGGSAPHWSGYAPASLHVPEISLAR